ncbi:1-deoxyxylulose-5-phosphate synthase YajO [Biomphalaria glabrata]|nr:1-deoxyxylulose-5-phosphate synthase YajO [Biomphalaria glabrata]
MTTEVSSDNKLPSVFLGQSGLKVSNLCLGTMTFGESQTGRIGQSDEDLSHQIINRFVERGGNFFDTANVYGRGTSENILGKWLERQTRENFIIATKVRSNMGVENNPNNVGLSRKHITSSIDASLGRLRTDYVDLFQAHAFDDGTRLEETLRTFDDLVRAGKVRYIGVSNFTGWQLQKLVDTSERLGLNPIVSLQQQYSLVCRESEFEPFQVCKTAGIGVLPWSPLKGGLLTGKVKRGVEPTEGRLGWSVANAKARNQTAPVLSSLSDRTFDIIESAENIGQKYGRSVAQVALRWLLQKDVVSSVIIGARTLEQLEDNLGAGSGWALSQEEMNLLDDLSKPSIQYPYGNLIQRNADRQNRNAISPYVKSI